MLFYGKILTLIYMGASIHGKILACRNVQPDFSVIFLGPGPNFRAGPSLDQKFGLARVSARKIGLARQPVGPRARHFISPKARGLENFQPDPTLGWQGEFS